MMSGYDKGEGGRMGKSYLKYEKRKYKKKQKGSLLSNGKDKKAAVEGDCGRDADNDVKHLSERTYKERKDSHIYQEREKSGVVSQGSLPYFEDDLADVEEVSPCYMNPAASPSDGIQEEKETVSGEISVPGMKDPDSAKRGEKPQEAELPKVLLPEPVVCFLAKDGETVIHPALPKPKAIYHNGLTALGFSQQGRSHARQKKVCQDRFDIQVLLKRNIILAAVSDGVGSCDLSDIGASCAVQTALDQIREDLSDQTVEISKANMGIILRRAMRAAKDQVDRLAAKAQILPYSFYATLTIAVYDSRCLYFGHAGDDGIVALTESGVYEMVTIRHKGEEASSVYPLQNESTWQLGAVENVVAFIMATDGVLDYFVKGEFENNRIYYPFAEPAFMARIESLETVRNECVEWQKILAGERFRERVTDDITFVAVTNQALTSKMQQPAFDAEKWKRDSEEYRRKREEILYPDGISGRDCPQTGQEKTQHSSFEGRDVRKDPGVYRNTSLSSKEGRSTVSASPKRTEKEKTGFMDNFFRSILK